MIASGLSGVDFIVANTDAQALASSRAERIIQMGLQVTEGLGAGARPEVGKAAAEEALEEICDHLTGSHMVFLTAAWAVTPAQVRPQSSPERLMWRERWWSDHVDPEGLGSLSALAGSSLDLAVEKRGITLPT